MPTFSDGAARSPITLTPSHPDAARRERTTGHPPGPASGESATTAGGRCGGTTKATS